MAAFPPSEIADFTLFTGKSIMMEGTGKAQCDIFKTKLHVILHPSMLSAQTTTPMSVQNGGLEGYINIQRKLMKN